MVSGLNWKRLPQAIFIEAMELFVLVQNPAVLEEIFSHLCVHLRI